MADPVDPGLPPEPTAVSSSGGDWPAQAADTIVDLVDQVRDKTTGPVLTAARGMVFGLMAAVMIAIAAVLALIFAIRVLTELLPVWLAYVVLGTLFVLFGALVFRKRHVPPVL